MLHIKTYINFKSKYKTQKREDTTTVTAVGGNAVV